MKDFLNRFNSMVEELEGNPQIQVNRYEVNDPLSEVDIQIMEDRYNVEIEPTIKELYKQVNGLRLEWALLPSDEEVQAEDEGEIFGSIRLLEILQVFGGFDGKEWLGDLWFDWMDDEKKELKRTLKPFDYFYGEDSRCVCFKLEDHVLKSQLVLHSVDYGVRELNIDFDEYLGLLLETRGFFSWQFLLLKNKKSIHNYNLYYSSLNYYCSRLFPNAHLSKLLKTEK